MKKLMGYVTILAMLCLLTACTTFKMSGVQMVMDTPQYHNVADLDVTVQVNKFLGSSGGATFANIGEEATDNAIYDAIRREVTKAGGDAAVNVTIDYKANLGDLLLNNLSGFLWAPSHVHITGYIVKYESGSSSNSNIIINN